MCPKNTRIIFSDPKLTYNSYILLRKCVVFEHYDWVTCTVQKILWGSPDCIMSSEPNIVVYAENLCLCKFQITVEIAKIIVWTWLYFSWHSKVPRSDLKRKWWWYHKNFDPWNFLKCLLGFHFFNQFNH